MDKLIPETEIDAEVFRFVRNNQDMAVKVIFNNLCKELPYSKEEIRGSLGRLVRTL